MRAPSARGDEVRLTERVFLVGSGEPDLATTDLIDSQVYLVDGRDGYLCVDAGAGRRMDAILATIRADGLDPEAIRWVVLTHGHADHAGGSAAWRRALPRVQLAASDLVGQWLASGDEVATSVDRARSAGMYPPEYRLSACEIDRALADGDVIEVGDVVLRAIATPGHAAGHLALAGELEGTMTVFSGDALFPEGRILLQDTWDCDLHDALRSVERLADLRAERLFAGHLGPVTSGAERHLAIALDRIGRLLVPDGLR
jgi:hydroxyacylglutathione hydrolase